MRAHALVAAVSLVALASVSGCNALTGASDLEKVECGASSPCVEDPSLADASVEVALDGALPEVAPTPDTAVDETSSDVEVDTSVAEVDPAEIGDGSDSIDTSPADMGPLTKDTGIDAKPDTGLCKTDVDCDDGDPCSRDTCSLFKSCTHLKSVDDDGDGDSPKGAGPLCGGDCHDGNAKVHSKQKSFFPTPYDMTDGKVSWDYDCDGITTFERTTLFKCTILIGTSCTVTTPGWTTTTVPACGVVGTWATSCLVFGGMCMPGGATKVTQGCR